MNIYSVRAMSRLSGGLTYLAGGVRAWRERRLLMPRNKDFVLCNGGGGLKNRLRMTAARSKEKSLMLIK